MDSQQPLECSDPLDYSGNVTPVCCPSGSHIAYIADKTTIIVRDVQTLSVVAYRTCPAPPNNLSWSPNGRHLMCAMGSSGTISVFLVVDGVEKGDENCQLEETSSKGNGQDENWSCNISQGVVGVATAMWSPCGRYVLMVSEFQVKMTIWSLSDGSCVDSLVAPKSEGMLAFSTDGTILAVVKRSDCKDTLCAYRCDTWQLLFEVYIPTTDAIGCSWSPDSSCLVVWDSLSCGNFIVAVSSEGDILMEKGWSSQHGLGVKTVSWCPSGSMFAVGSHDMNVVLFNPVTWSTIDTLAHQAVVNEVKSEERPMVAYVEEYVDDDGNNESVGTQKTVDTKQSVQKSPSRDSVSGRRSTSGHIDRQTKTDRTIAEEDKRAGISKYEIISPPFKIPSIRVPTDEVHPKLGVSMALWCPTGKYLATKCDDKPTAVWIWDIANLRLETLLIHKAAVRGMAWRPGNRSNLVIVCGNECTYSWKPEYVSCTAIPVDNFKASGIQWCEKDIYQIWSKDKFCCCFLQALAP